MEQPTRERPFGVTLIAILLGVNGIVAILSALGALGATPQGAFGTVIGIVFGVALLYLAYGMWTLRGWAWMATIFLEGLNALFAVIALLTAPAAIGAWISLILAAIIILYLVQPGVREEFGPRRAGL